MVELSEFAVSMVFGAIIIVLFSWDQFKMPSYQSGRDIMRIAANLTPPDMCNHVTYLRSFVFYTIVLILIYFAFTLFATPAIVQTLGLLPGGIGGAVEAAGDDGHAVAETVKGLQSPIGPLAVALMMVGLAPKTGFLQKVEGRIRLIAHRLSGIPAQLVKRAQRLRAKPLVLPEDRGNLLIPERDWGRLRLAENFAARAPRPDLFVNDLIKIIAYRAWFLETPDPLATLRRDRPGMAARNAELTVEIEALLDAIDAFGVAVAGRHDRADAPPTNEDVEVERRLITKFADDAAKLSADVCAMMALYREHGALDRVSDDEAPDERQGAVRILASYLDVGADSRCVEADAFALWWRAALPIGVVAFVVGLRLGNLENGTELYALQAGATIAVSAFFIYAPALLVALLVHAHYCDNDEQNGNVWPNVFTTNWANWMGPVAVVALAAALTALLCGVALNLYWTFSAVGLAKVLSGFWGGAREALLFEGPRYLLGVILALGVIASIDAWRASDTAATRRARYIAILVATVLAMAMWAAAARGLAAQYAAISSGKEVPEIATLLFDDSRMGLQALRAAIIGFVTLLVCQNSIAVLFARPQMASADAPATPATGAPVAQH